MRYRRTCFPSGLRRRNSRWNRLHQSSLRRTVCLAVVLNLLIWPSPKVTLAPLDIPSEELTYTFGAVASTFAELGAAPVVLIPSGPILIPVPLFPVWPFQVSSPVTRDLSVAERTAVVSSITVSPNKLVGYIGDVVTFVAMGMDAPGRPAHGARFTWASSDEGKLTVDEAGRATLVAPGLVIVTCSAGVAVKTTPVLIRPARRRVQTDQEGKADQDSLIGDGREPGGGGQGVLASLIDLLLAPAAPCARRARRRLRQRCSHRTSGNASIRGGARRDAARAGDAWKQLRASDLAGESRRARVGHEPHGLLQQQSVGRLFRSGQE